METVSSAKRGALTATVSEKIERYPHVHQKFWHPMVSMKHLKCLRRSGVHVSLEIFELLKCICVTPKCVRFYIAHVSLGVPLLAHLASRCHHVSPQRFETPQLRGVHGSPELL